MENNPQTQAAPEKDGLDAGPVVFDTASGFSVEEQQEILDRINSLSVEKGIVPPEGTLTNLAKKRGVLFPLLVNAGAVLLLAGGFFLLWIFHSRDEQDIRMGSAVLGITERVLIQEIRQETSRQLDEKENEINEILIRLSDAGAEYRQLELSVESLSEEQQERAEYLYNLQNEYQDTLSRLQNERTVILENARVREAGMRAQAENRVRELSTQIEQGQASFDAAMEELSRLSSDQNRAAQAEAQLNGFYVMANQFINAGELEDAAGVLESMKDFLESPLFQNSRSMETRRQIYQTALNTLENTLAHAQSYRDSGGNYNPVPVQQISQEDISAGIAEAVVPYQARISELEQANQAQQRIIAALNSQDSSQSRLIAEYDTIIANQQNLAADLVSQITGLQNVNSGQQQSINQQNDLIADLRNQNAVQEQRYSQLNTTASAQERQISQLNSALSVQEQEVSRLNTEAVQMQNRYMDLAQSNEDLYRRMDLIPGIIEETIENPEIQDLLGPISRQALRDLIQQAIQEAIQ